MMNYGQTMVTFGIRAFIFILIIRVTRSAARWFQGIRWLLHGPEVLGQQYLKSGCLPFTIKTPERSYVVVSSNAHIDELSRAKEEHLSLVQVAEEVFQPVHTMDGVELNRLGMQRRILRSLTQKFPILHRPLTDLIVHALAELCFAAPKINGWHEVRIFALTQRATGKANIQMFYGEKYTRHEGFLKAALQYPVDVFVASELLRCLPSFMAPLVSWLATRGHRSSRYLLKQLLPIIRSRLRSNTAIKPDDYIQYIIDLNPSRDENAAEKIAQQTLALWFASVHQPAISLFYALIDLCTHGEYQEALLEEIEQNTNENGNVNIGRLDLLDSFLKESARMNSSETISLRRKALTDYCFKDGLKVTAGSWVCVPQRALMRDATIYPQPEIIDGRRFLAEKKVHQPSSGFTDMHRNYPFWGLGKQGCPGRFYASFIMKLVMVEIIRGYELKLPDSKHRTFTWRSAILPSPFASFHMRKR